MNNAQIERMRKESEKELQMNSNTSLMGDNFQPMAMDMGMGNDLVGSPIEGDNNLFDMNDDPFPNEPIDDTQTRDEPQPKQRQQQQQQQQQQDEVQQMPPGTGIHTKKNGSNLENEVEQLRGLRDDLNNTTEPVWMRGMRQNNALTEQEEQQQQKQQPPPQQQPPQQQPPQQQPPQQPTQPPQQQTPQQPEPSQSQSLWTTIKLNSITFIVIALIMIFINLPLIDSVIQGVFLSVGLNATTMNVVIMKALVGASIFLVIHKLSTE